jgi:hypothetical protein
VSAPGFFDTLESQLGDGLDHVVQQRARRRQRAQRATGGLAIGLLLLVGFVFVGGRDSASAGVEVETTDGLVYVRLTDVEYRADVIEDAARDAGLAVTVEAVATGPSLVGRFVGWFQTDDSVGQLQELDEDGPSFTGFVLPAGYDGALTIRVGRPAEHDDEAYEMYTNAVSAGEPLACTGIVGADGAGAADIVEAHHLTAAWARQDERQQQPITPDDARNAGDLRVARVLTTSPTTVLVVLAPPGAALPPVELTAPATC